MVVFAALIALAGPKPFAFTGSFFEGCSCGNACVFELTGANSKCNGAGFYSFDAGKYGGKSFAHTKASFVAGADGWVRLYIDGPTAQSRETAKSFIMAALKDWGKPEAVEFRKIQLTHHGDRFTGTIDGGKILSLEVQASRQADGELLVHRHIFNKLLHPEIVQAQNRACKFHEGKRQLDFRDSNGFFNSALKVRGKV